MLHYLKLMLQILMAPKRGWEDVEAEGETARLTLLRGLLPLVAVASLTVGVGALYELHPSFSALLIQAVVVFARYVICYFFMVAVLTYALPRLTLDGLVNRERVELICAYSVGQMAIIGILQNLLPMELTLLQFLAIWVIVAIYQGRRFLDVDENNSFRFIAVSMIGILLPIYLIDWLLLPAA